MMSSKNEIRLFFSFFPLQNLYPVNLWIIGFILHSFILHLNSSSVILPQTNFDIESFHLPFGNTVIECLTVFL